MQVDLRLGDCVSIMKDMDDKSVDLILTDPPYFKVKNEPWDNQWSKPTQFLAWLDTVLEQFQRILKPNGSLYLFASPQMAARVEMLISERFNVLNSIRWHKDSGWHKKAKKEDLRSYLTPWEACVFAEQFGCEYADAEKALHKEVFAPLGRYIQTERERAGLTRSAVEVALGYVSSADPTKGTALCYRWEEGSSLPTAETYGRLRSVLNASGGDFLRREYEDLRREYEDLRRPFTVTADVPHTDLWAFEPVRPYPGKHPCEKPQPMLEHIISSSSRPGGVVFDAFAGTGSTGIAAARMGRKFIGCEMSHDHHADALRRISAANDNTPPMTMKRKKSPANDNKAPMPDLFGAA